MFDCSICCDENIKLPVIHNCCKFTCCRNCFCRYLLESTSLEPKCMSCNKDITLDFVSNNMTKTMYSNDYRNKRANILLSREISKLPYDDTEFKIYKLEEKEKEYRKKYRELKREISGNQDKIDILTKKIRECKDNEQLKKLREELHSEYQIRRYNRSKKNTSNMDLKIKAKNTREIIDSTYDEISKLRGDTGTKNTRKEFIMKCFDEKCNGFLSTKWICKSCDKKYCNKCRTIIDNEHKCDPNLVETYKLLKKDTKNCPSCHVPITYIDGCDQMFCTECKTAFSWRTGKIDKGRIHNPHYFEWRRTRKGNEEDEIKQNNCEQYLIEYNDLVRVLRTEPNVSVKNFNVYYRVILELFEKPEPTVPDNIDMRIKYLDNKIDKDKLLTMIKRRQKKYEKELDEHDIVKLFLSVATELVYKYYFTKEYILKELLKDLKGIACYCLGIMENIMYKYGNILKTSHFFEYLSQK